MSELVTPEEARQVLENEQRQRLEQCQQELDALLQKYRCQLATQIGVSPDGRLVANIVLTNAT